MERAEVAAADQRRALPLILIAAVVQGWALYALHFSIKHQVWPATAVGWLLAFYAVVGFTPVTVQLLAQHARSRVMWWIVAAMAAAFFYFGWHHGANVADQATSRFIESGDAFPLAVVLLVLWLMGLPFAQCRLASGRWGVAYSDLFATAWRNKLVLGEAALFTALFWLLLFLWQMLFHMLGIDYFKELFEEPIFVYPVTSLTFGIALHLIGSLDRLTSIVLEQALNVLKWLAIVAGLILALFSVALVFKLPGLVFHGERAIGAAWLLWLVAVIVLLVNAAYRDGSVVQPYPRWIALALRIVVPLTILIAVTALYALYVRVSEYGFTVARVWAFIVASASLVYAIGYGVAAFRRGGWMNGIFRVNVAVALGLIAVIALTLTPILSPYRLAANSQYERALALSGVQEDLADWHAAPFHYLRFNTGRYGAAKLRVLAHVTDGPHAAEIREAAQSAIAQQQQQRSPPVPANIDRVLAQLVVYPQGKDLTPALSERLAAGLRKPDFAWTASGRRPDLAGVYVDLNGDSVDEFVLLLGGRGYAYRNDAGAWKALGLMTSGGLWHMSAETRALQDGDVSVRDPKWKELRIGRSIYRLGQSETAEH